jgi:hypothetical protein
MFGVESCVLRSGREPVLIGVGLDRPDSSDRPLPQGLYSDRVDISLTGKRRRLFPVKDAHRGAGYLFRAPRALLNRLIDSSSLSKKRAGTFSDQHFPGVAALGSFLESPCI